MRGGNDDDDGDDDDDGGGGDSECAECTVTTRLAFFQPVYDPQYSLK